MHDLQPFTDGQPLQRLVWMLLLCVSVGCLAVACSDDLPLRPAGVVTCLGLAVAAAICYFLCKRALERGIALDRWSDEEMRRVRVRLSTATGGIAILFLLVMAAAIVTRFTGHHRLSAFGTWLPLWLLSMTMNSVIRLLPLPPSTGRGTLWIDTMKPIHSDHWGQGAG